MFVFFFRGLLLFTFIFLFQPCYGQPSFLLAKRFGGPNFDLGASVVVDGAGNIYTTGFFRGTADFDPGPGIFNLTAAGSFDDIFVSKLDLNGNFVWAVSAGGTSFDEGRTIILDNSGNVCVTGKFESSVDFDPSSGTFILTSAGSCDIFLWKLDPNGNLVLAERFGGFGQDYGFSLTQDPSGNILITGNFSSSTADFDPGTGVFNLSAAVGATIFICKVDATGNFIWAKAFGGNWNTYCESIKPDNAGNIYLTGSFMMTCDFDAGPGTFNITSNGNTDMYIAKYDSAGNFLWARSMGGTGVETGNSVEVDATGNVYSTGSFESSVDFDPGPAILNITSAGNEDIYLVKLDSGGNLLWAHGFGGIDDDYAHSMALEQNGNIFIIGDQYSFNADHDPGPAIYNLSNPSSEANFIDKFNPNGNYLCGFVITPGHNETMYNRHICVVGSSLYVSASFTNTPDFDPCTGIANMTTVGNGDVYIAKYDIGNCCCQPLYLSPSQSNISCFGFCNGSAVVNVTGGAPPYSYTWSPSGGNNNIATGLCTGTYTCTVTDNIGITVSATFAITAPLLLSSAISGTDLLCNAACTGSAAVNTSGGTAPYTYSWSNMQTSASIGSLCSGNYSVTVTDNYGCITTQNINITEPVLLTATISATSTPCATNNGSVNVNATGGTGQLNYLWLPGGDTTSTVSNLAGGVYMITITDNNGCSITLSDTVDAIGAPIVDTAGIAHIACYGDSTGVAMITASGNGPFSYLWMPYGGNAASASGLVAGSYTTTVTDSIGCTQSRIISINEPNQISVSIVSGDDSCSISNGFIAVATSGGTGPFTYQWSNNQTISTIVNLIGGTYSVTIMDNNGCLFDTAATIISTLPPGLVISSQNNVLCFGDSTGSAVISVIGSSAPYTYTWQPIGGSNASSSGLSSGTYTVSATGNDGCSSTLPVIITEPPPISISCGSASENCNYQDGYAYVIASGGVGNYNYLWNNSSSSDSAFQIAAGSYSVQVTDQNGCVTTCTTVVSSTATVAADAGTDIWITQGQSAILSGSGGYVYSWQPSGLVSCNSCAITTTSPSVTTIFTLTVTDSAGCTDYDTIVIFVDIPCDDIFVPNAFSPNGDGQNDMLFVRGTCIASMNMQIYNRWGEKVFESSDVSTSWDGTWRGMMCENAVFTFLLIGTTTNGSPFEKHGNISIVK